MKFISGRIILSVLLTAAAVLLNSCASTKIQTAEVFTAPYRSPIKILDEQKKGSVEIKTQFSFERGTVYMQNVGGHTNVDENGNYVVETVPDEDYFLERKGANQYNFQSENLTWNFPSIQGLVDLEYYFTDHGSMYAGLSAATINNKTYLGQKLGLAFNSPGKLSLRLSSDVKFQQTGFNVQYLRVDDWRTGSNTREVRFFNKIEKVSFTSLNFAIALNTRGDNWLVDFFAGYAFGYQKLFEVYEFNETESYSSLSVGIYKRIMDEGRLVIGTRYTIYYSEITKIYPLDFFVQYDFILK